MLKASLIKIFERDLLKLKEEINLFTDENDIWLNPGSIKNSAGNLTLHICGNLNHYVGHILGNTNYKRQREKEFSLKNVPVDELINNIEETSEIIKNTIQNLKENSFQNIYPLEVFNEEMTTEFFLIHLATHLNYHLGQINYLRRIMMD